MEDSFEKMISSATVHGFSPTEDTLGSTAWWNQIVELSHLQEIQDRFAKKLRVGAIITTIDGTPVTQPSQFSRFCLAMRELDASRDCCIRSDSSGGNRSVRAGRVILYRCPHGLLDMASPIIVGKRQVGVLLCGQVRLSEYNEQQLQQIVDTYWGHVDFAHHEPLKELFKKTDRVDRRMIRMAMELLHVLTSHVVAQCEQRLAERQLLQREIAMAQIERKKELLEKSLRQAQLKLLENQLNPHFMFNTLNIISRLALFEKAPQTQSLILQFSEYLRYLLKQQAHSELVALRMEIECVTRYLNIYKIRLGERLHFHVDIPTKTQELLVPLMLLQPLVENAIVHGIEPLPEGGELVIRSCIDHKEQQLVLVIQDSGCGFEPDPNRYGIGLRNVTERIRLHYKDRGSILIQAQKGLGCKISVRIPV